MYSYSFTYIWLVSLSILTEREEGEMKLMWQHVNMHVLRLNSALLFETYKINKLASFMYHIVCTALDSE